VSRDDCYWVVNALSLQNNKEAKILQTLSLKGSIASLNYHLDQVKELCVAFLTVTFIKVPQYILSVQLKNERCEKESMSVCIDRNNHRRKLNFVPFKKRCTTANEQNI